MKKKLRDEKQKEKNEKYEKREKRPEPVRDTLDADKTVFVRNITYTTTQSELQEFMEKKFGPVKFALMVKQKGATNENAHKGSAFVKFKNPNAAEKAVETSNKFWQQDQSKHALNTQEAISLNSLVQQELELNGRLVVILQA